MKAIKGSRKIVLDGVEYRWRATGSSGTICLTVWPRAHRGGTISGTLRYDEKITQDENFYGCWLTPTQQIVVTNVLVRQVIEHAVAKCGYSHVNSLKELSLGALEEKIDCAVAVRAQGKQ